MSLVRRVVVAAVSLVTTAAACGPMPGYVPPQQERAQTEAPEARTQPPAQAPVEADGPAPPRRADPAPTPPAPPARAEGAASDMQIVQLGGPDTYYLIDRKRQLCFLHHKSAVTSVECSQLPEASDFARPTLPTPSAPQPPTAAPAPAQPLPTPSQGTRRHYVEPAPEPEPTEPAPAPRVIPAPDDKPSVEPPTPEELTRFEAAYFAIFCDRWAGNDTQPDSRIAAENLTVQRYGEIEAWWASDTKAWWALTSKARRTCTD